MYNSGVRDMWVKLVNSGMSEKDAAKAVQEKTGHSAVSGMPIDNKIRFTKKMTYRGQHGIPTK